MNNQDLVLRITVNVGFIVETATLFTFLLFF